MKPVEFPQVNLKLGKGQPQYRILPAYVDNPSPEDKDWKRFIFKYELSELDLALMIKAKGFFFTIQGYGFNPVFPSMDNPFESLQISYLGNECWVPLEDGNLYHIEAESPMDMVEKILDRFKELKPENLLFVEKPIMSINEKGELEQ